MKYSSIALTLSLQLGLTACDSSSSSSHQPPTLASPTPTPNPTPGKPDDGLGLKAGLSLERSNYLVNIGNGVAELSSQFSRATEQLHAGVKQYCANKDANSLETLRTQYREAMLIWQRLELFQMGPLTAANGTLKAKIYGWPQLSNYCKIDEESMLAAEDPEYKLPSNTNRKGLQALEYLVFDSSLATICPSVNPVKAEWEALSSEEKWTARCAYMTPVSLELSTNAKDLSDQWGVSGNNVLSRAIGNAQAEQDFLQAIFNNLFYLDLEVKNQKLAAPAGQDIKVCNKTPSPCPDKEELRFSHLSKEALTANFRALADIIFGFGSPRNGGMSALVRHEGGNAVADKSETSISALVNSNEKETASFDSLITAKASEDCETSQVSWLCQVRQSIRSIVADFKGEYASVLKTQVPVAPQGDND